MKLSRISFEMGLALLIGGPIVIYGLICILTGHGTLLCGARPNGRRWDAIPVSGPAAHLAGLAYILFGLGLFVSMMGLGPLKSRLLKGWLSFILVGLASYAAFRAQGL